MPPDSIVKHFQPIPADTILGRRVQENDERNKKGNGCHHRYGERKSMQINSLIRGGEPTKRHPKSHKGRSYGSPHPAFLQRGPP